ncbi:MAG TPA: glutamate--tRNA ligase, partial [Spirochaetaceae bacterium]|nr:glutamate--tRNA ligase [Spirochaetaceae bacterium]
PPKFCHLPMVMGKDGQKLSKRHGSTSLRQFVSEGYLKESIINYVTLVGWAYDGEREIFSKQELEKIFDMSKIHPSPAVFDYKKLDWFNGMYIREKSDGELIALLEPFFSQAGIRADEKRMKEVLPLIKERLKKLSDAPDMVRFLFGDVSYSSKDDFAAKGDDAAKALHYLKVALSLFEKAKTLQEAEAVEARLQEISQQDGVKANSVFMPLRVAITSSRVSPPLFASIKLLGIDETVRRIRKSVSFLES